LDDRGGAGGDLDPRRPRGHHRGCARCRADPSFYAASDRGGGRTDSVRLSGRFCRRGILVLVPHRPAGAKEMVHAHTAPVPCRHPPDAPPPHPLPPHGLPPLPPRPPRPPHLPHPPPPPSHPPPPPPPP